MIQGQFSKDRKLYVAFVDYKKAFDNVNRNALWTVLRKSGVHNRMLRALQGIYSHVQSAVRYERNEDPTDYFDCPFGLKQGCLASPMLFSFLFY